MTVKRTTCRLIRVFRSGLDRRRGRLRVGAVEIPCALGAGGPVRRKREGDGGTPLGTMRIRGGFYRADRMRRPRTGLPMRPIARHDGWCDDVTSRRYNRPVRLPVAVSHERMWREDRLYDIVLDLDWNRGPIVRGRGSAIFLHLARPGFTPTEGCVAIARPAMLRLLARIGLKTRIEIRG